MYLVAKHILPEEVVIMLFACFDEKLNHQQGEG